MELDHVLLAVTDLTAAARELQARCGLASVEGGRHPDWGTANRIVPLGTSYLELVADVDQQAAAGSSFGRWVARGASSAPSSRDSRGRHQQDRSRPSVGNESEEPDRADAWVAGGVGDGRHG